MFQTRLKKLREFNGFTSQQSFADSFGVAQSTVGGWEAGAREPNFATVTRLANFFGVTIDYLIGEGNPDKYSSEFCERLSCELSAIRESFAGDEPEIADLYRLEDFAANPHLMSLYEACKVADEVGVTVGYLLGEEDVESDDPSETKKSPDSDESEPRDEMEREAIRLVRSLELPQKTLALSILRTVAAENQGKPGADQVSAAEKVQETERQGSPK